MLRLHIIAVATALLLMISACSSAPPSQAPTSQVPISSAPTSSAPTAQAPTSSAPTAQAPTSSAPTPQATSNSAPTAQAATSSAPTAQASIDDVVIYASDLPESALSEFEFWDDPASPGGKMVGTPNTGGNLDPPPENDPHVTFNIPVQGSVAYRCWIHMKVGAPQGESEANMLWAQFSDAVDKANQEVLKPDTDSYLTAQGPQQEGWTWVGCDMEDDASSEPLIYFRSGGEVTVRLQAGMEGVGFDQFLLSPARFLQKPPTEAVVEK